MRYLFLYVVKRIGRVDSEADQDDMRVGVGKRAETVVIFLASSIPEGEFDVLAIDLDVGDVVFENGGDIDLAITLASVCRARQGGQMSQQRQGDGGAVGARLTQLRDGGGEKRDC